MEVPRRDLEVGEVDVEAIALQAAGAGQRAVAGAHAHGLRLGRHVGRPGDDRRQRRERTRRAVGQPQGALRVIISTRP